LLVNTVVKRRAAPARRDSRTEAFRAAAEEFAERGFEAAGVDRIAARAGVNKAMLYYHFGSKQGLYVEVLRDMFRAVGVRARDIADGPGTAPEKFDRWIAALVEEAAARPWFPPIMLREVASRGTHLDQDTVELLNVVFGAVRDVIAQGQREGTFDDVDPLLTHLTIMPPILIFFARQRLIAAGRRPRTLLTEPRQLDDFVRHMQRSAGRMLRRDPLERQR
jgi:AcrR family transcriptional regulator